MLELPYTALVTPAEVKKAAAGSFSETIRDGLDVPGSGEDSDIYDACVGVIVDVTSRIEDYLHRHIIVRAVEQEFDSEPHMIGDWVMFGRERTAAGDAMWTAYAREWPVLQLVSVDGASAHVGDVVVRQDGRILAYDPAALDSFPYSADYFAGYRRADQDLAELQAESGLSALTVLPAVLPGLIKRVALRLVIHELRTQLQGLVGVERTSKQIDRLTVQSQRQEEDFEGTELVKLAGLAYEPA